MNARKMMAPRDAKTNAHLCGMRSDNYSCSTFWIVMDGHEVTIRAQRNGEAPTAAISVPRAEFNKLINWYTKPQPWERKRRTE